MVLISFLLYLTSVLSSPLFDVIGALAFLWLLLAFFTSCTITEKERAENPVYYVTQKGKSTAIALLVFTLLIPAEEVMYIFIGLVSTDMLVDQLASNTVVGDLLTSVLEISQIKLQSLKDAVLLEASSE